MRFLGWFRRRPQATGRHTRVVPSPTVPGAAAALVANAFDDAVAPHQPEPVDTMPALVDVGDPLLDTVPHAWALDPVPILAGADPHAPGVLLGFADGGSFELAADDPRATTFRAAAAALLDGPNPATRTASR